MKKRSKSNKTSYIKDIVNTLESLSDRYNKIPLYAHISLAIADYPKNYSLTDKELAFSLQKYLCELDLDMGRYIIPESEINSIMNDDLFDNIYDEDEFEDY